MSSAPPEAGQWQRIAPYLDQALDLQADERERWLTDLAAAEPEIAGAVRQLLAEHAELQKRGFLALPALDPVRHALDEASVTMRESQVDADTSAALAHTIVQGKVWVGQGRLRDAVAAFGRVRDSYTKLDCCPAPHGLALIERAAALAADSQFEAAARDAQAGIELAQQAQGQLPSSSLTGQAWLTLAQVERAQGHASAAHRAYELAVRNLVETLGEEHADTVRARKGMSDT